MNRRLRWLLPLFALPVACGSGHDGRPQEAGPPQDYVLHHAETTGLTLSVVVGGEDHAIELAGDSDPRMLGALQRLHGDVLAPSAEAGHLHVVGWLRPEPMRTPDQPGMATSEAYQELRLASWYLEAPFGRYQ